MTLTKIAIPTTNYDTSSKPKTKIVIHWIVGNLASADAVFKKVGGGTSAHYGVEDDQVHQYVEEQYTAYHAGNYAVNQESIGIEHSASPDRPASEATYKTSGELIYQISKRHNIPLDRQHIIKHSEVKATQCPGTMDLDKLINIAKSFAISLPNPGYPPTMVPQTVEKEGIVYESYKDASGQLLWKIRPATPVDWQKLYEDEKNAHDNTKVLLSQTNDKVTQLTKDLATANERVTSIKSFVAGV